MKIYFHKESGDIYPRISCCYEGVEKCIGWPNASENRLKTAVILLTILSCVGIMATSVLNRERNFSYIAFLIILGFLLLPLHEFCHALYLLLTRREIEGIYFLKIKWKKLFTSPAAYVMSGFAMYSKFEFILFSAFPLLILTELPLLIGIFVPTVFPYCIIVSLANLATSSGDVYHIVIRFMRYPKNGRIFTPFGVFFPSGDMMVFRTITKKYDSDVLIKRQFVCKGKKCTEVPFEHNDQSKKLEKEFFVQYGLTTDSE